MPARNRNLKKNDHPLTHSHCMLFLARHGCECSAHWPPTESREALPTLTRLYDPRISFNGIAGWHRAEIFRICTVHTSRARLKDVANVWRAGRASISNLYPRLLRTPMTHRPTNCLRMRTPGVRPDDNYSRVISHFICKIASADRPKAAINFPPLKLFRWAAKITTHWADPRTTHPRREGERAILCGWTDL